MSNSIHKETEFTIYHEQGRACITSDICKLSNGTLAVAFRDGLTHSSIDGDIMLCTSMDEGQTWNVPQMIRDGSHPPVKLRTPSLCELSDGTLILNFFRFNGQQNRTWDGSHVIVLRSFDGGNTWSEENEICPLPFGFMLTNERCIELASGRILMPVYAGSQRYQYIVSGVLYSDNRGADWNYLSTIDTLPFYQRKRFYMENAIAETMEGKLVAVSRTQKHMIQAMSQDGGISWQHHRTLTDTPPDTQPSLLCASDGTLLLSYGDRGPLPRNPSYPYSITIKKSTDGGLTWDSGFVLRENLPHWDMGYPTTIELSPGSFMTVYWRSELTEASKWPNGLEYWISGIKWRM